MSIMAAEMTQLVQQSCCTQRNTYICTQGDISILEGLLQHILNSTCRNDQPTAPDMSLACDQALLAELLLIFAGEYFHLAKVPKLKAKRMTQKNQATPQTSSVVSSFISCLSLHRVQPINLHIYQNFMMSCSIIEILCQNTIINGLSTIPQIL